MSNVNIVKQALIEHGSSEALAALARLLRVKATTEVRDELTRLREENATLTDSNRLNAEALQAEEDKVDTLLAALRELEKCWVTYCKNAGDASVDAALNGSVLKDRMAGENRAWHVALEELRAVLHQHVYAPAISEVEGEE